MSEKSVGRKSRILSKIPPPRIKKILQTDEEIGKMANPVPVVIARALEVFIEKLLTKSVDVTHQRLAKTLTPQHIKECVKSEPTFHFLQAVTACVPDLGSEGVHHHAQGSFSETAAAANCGVNLNAASNSTGAATKRRGSKNLPGISKASSANSDKPPQKRRRRSKRSLELPADLSEDDDEDVHLDDPNQPPAKHSSPPQLQQQSTASGRQEMFELGPTSSDDVPDDPSIS